MSRKRNMNIKKPAQLTLSNAISLSVTAFLFEGLVIDFTLITVFLGAVILMLSQMIVQPILKFISFPINLITMGFFNFVISAIVLYIAVYFVDGISLTSGELAISIPFLGDLIPGLTFGPIVTLVLAAASINIINWILKKLLF